jgi:hypothetical protein
MPSPKTWASVRIIQGGWWSEGSGSDGESGVRWGEGLAVSGGVRRMAVEGVPQVGVDVAPPRSSWIALLVGSTHDEPADV